MIVQGTVQGKPALIQYLLNDNTPTTKDKADQVKVLFDDGGSMRVMVTKDVQKEDKGHPFRGNQYTGGIGGLGKSSLYHGTDGDALKKIMAEGFKASTYGVFGPGVYTVDALSAATNYSSVGGGVVEVGIRDDAKIFHVGDRQDWDNGVYRHGGGKDGKAGYLNEIASKGFHGFSVDFQEGEKYVVITDLSVLSSVKPVTTKQERRLYLRKPNTVGTIQKSEQSTALGSVLKSNAFRDALGRFTSKAKAVQTYARQVGTNYQRARRVTHYATKMRMDHINIFRVLEFKLFGKVNWYPLITKDENVVKSNPYRDALGRWATKEKATSTVSFEQDMAAQFGWLESKAKEHGKASVDALVMETPELFQALGLRWRRYHTFKANPYHDAQGRFAAKEGANFVSIGGKFGRPQGSSVSSKQVDAVRTYSRSGDLYAASTMNHYLRNGSLFSKNETESEMVGRVREIDALISANKLPRETTFYRGTALSEYGVPRGTDPKSLVGKTLTDKGYSSTSDDRDVVKDAYVGGGVMLVIRAPKGVSALDMNSHGGMAAISSEREFLLPRGSKFRVDSVETVPKAKPWENDSVVVHVSVLNEARKYGQFDAVLKANPYHDAQGRFAAKDGANFVSSWGKPKDFVPAEKPPAMSDDERREVVRRFTQSGGTYREVNEHLRDGRDATDTAKKTIDLLDDMFKNSAVPVDKVLHRGLSGYDPEELGLSVGTTFKDNGFVSTSGSLAEAKKFAAHDPSGKPQGEEAVGILFKINARGSKMLDLRGYSRYGEEELLLPRGSTFKVTGVKYGEAGKSFSVVTLSVVES